MAVVSLDIYPGDDPNGTALVTLTDADVAEFELRVGENELGGGSFKIRRDHPDATEANLASGNYVKVTIPIIDTDPCWGFWIDEHADTILANDEEGGEFLVRSGFGPLFVLARALLLDQRYVLSQSHRGSYDVPGYWTWLNEPYGAILKRLIEEGQEEPGTPLADVTTDFTREDDSDGNPWYTVTEELQFPIGSDGLEVSTRLVESGEVFLRPSTDLLIQAYKHRGRDLTGASFGAGVVRFVKGVNIDTSLDRKGHGIQAATHALVTGKDMTYEQVVSPDYTSGPGRWRAVPYDTSNDHGQLAKVGAENLRKRNDGTEAIEFQLKAGEDQVNGLYLPWVHFLTGDLVTLHTGTDPWDYNESEQRVVGWSLALGEVTRDTDGDGPNDYLAARSLEIAVQLSSGPTTGGLGGGTQDHGVGCTCLRLCHDPVAACAGGAYPLTPSQHFFPLGGPTSDADGYVYYRAPDAPLPAPQPLTSFGGMGFPTYGGPGAPDFTGDCLSVGVHFVMVGAGTLTIQTAAGTSVKTLVAITTHWTGIGGSTEATSAGFAPGDEVVVTVPSDGSLNCVHTVRIVETTGACGGSWGYAGADWVAVVASPIVGGPGATAGDGTQAAPCSHDHAYTADQITYGTGTVADALAAGSGAPTTADYLVGTAQGGLSAEIVVGTTPNGELGGTWGAITVDATHSGSSHAATQAAAEATAATALSGHTSDAVDAHDASAVSVLDTGGNFTGTDVEAVLAELATASGPLDPDEVRDAGHWEVIMVPGITSPPEPLQTIAGDDWVWGWVAG